MPGWWKNPEIELFAAPAVRKYDIGQRLMGWFLVLALAAVVAAVATSCR